MGHDIFFETTRHNRSNARANINWKNMSGIDHANIIDNKDKVKRAALAISKTDSINVFTHAVDL